MKNIAVKCPQCKEVCQLNEYVTHCPKCGRVFIEYMSFPRKKENDIGNRRSLENVDQD
jgi:uncharacterized Zn finger protein